MSSLTCLQGLSFADHPNNESSRFYPLQFSMAKRKRGPTKKRKGDAQELTFGDEAHEAKLPSTQTFTFLGSGSGRKDRTTHVRGLHGTPDVRRAPVTFVSAEPAFDVTALPDAGSDWFLEGVAVDDGVSEYDDSFSVAFDATEMHFGDDGDPVDDVQAIEAENEQEILGGVSAHFV
jgi:hypothetical protein